MTNAHRVSLFSSLMSNFHHLRAEKSGLISELIYKNLDLSPHEVDFLFEIGAIYLNFSRIKQDLMMNQNDIIRVHTLPKRYPVPTTTHEIIHFENDEFIIAIKPHGLPTHPTLDNSQENLLALLEKHFKITLYPCHRLDVPTKGLIVVAKTLEFQRAFQKNLNANLVDKKYIAHIHGKCAPQKYTHYMIKSTRAPKIITSKKTEQSIVCELDVKVLNERKYTSEVLVKLITGRTHQIRAQLSYLGSPILGDHYYGSSLKYDKDMIMLCCVELSFPNKNLTQKDWHFSFSMFS